MQAERVVLAARAERVGVAVRAERVVTATFAKLVKAAFQTERVAVAARSERVGVAVRAERVEKAVRAEHVGAAVRAERVGFAARAERVVIAARDERVRAAFRTERVAVATMSERVAVAAQAFEHDTVEFPFTSTIIQAYRVFVDVLIKSGLGQVCVVARIAAVEGIAPHVVRVSVRLELYPLEVVGAVVLELVHEAIYHSLAIGRVCPRETARVIAEAVPDIPCCKVAVREIGVAVVHYRLGVFVDGALVVRRHDDVERVVRALAIHVAVRGRDIVNDAVLLARFQSTICP